MKGEGSGRVGGAQGVSGSSEAALAHTSLLAETRTEKYVEERSYVDGDGNICDHFFGLYLASLPVLHQGCLVFH